MNTNPQPITVSPTKTYIIVVHDLVCPAETRFEKVVLPESFENNSKSARYYYYSISEDRADSIIASISYEAYMDLVNDIVDDTKLEKRKIKPQPHPLSINLKKDLEEVCNLLDAWNDQQKYPSTSYQMMLKSILSKLAFQEKFIVSLKKELLNL